MAGSTYKSGVALRESTLTTNIADVTDSAQSSIVNSFYVHSKVRNFYNNKRYVDTKSLAEMIDGKLSKDFEKAVKQARLQEQRIYKSLRIRNVQDMQDLFNLNNFQTKFNDRFSIYNIVQEAVNNYISKAGEVKTISSYQLQESLTEVSNDVRTAYTDLLEEYRDKILGNKSEDGVEMLIGTMDLQLQKIIETINTGQEIDLAELVKKPGRYLQHISAWQGISGEVAQYIAGLENKYIDYVEGELTRQLSGSKNKIDVRLNTTDNLKINLSVKNYRAPKDTQRVIDVSVHDGQKLSEFVRSIAKIGGAGRKDVINYFIYNMVNILAFTRSGGVVPSNVGRVDKRNVNEFEEYQQYIEIIRKTAIYWLGFKTLDKKEAKSFSGINFLVINGTIVPMSEILTELQNELLFSQSRMKSSLSNVPQFGPTVLWEEKFKVIQTLPKDYYTQGKRNYPPQLIRIGASIGQMIAEQTKVNVELSIAVSRLIRR